MIKFSVKSDRGEFLVTLDAGKLTTDPPVAQEMRFILQADGHIGPPGGPYWTGTDAMRHATPVYLMLKRAFDEVEVIDGELPDLPSVPKGAIT